MLREQRPADRGSGTKVWLWFAGYFVLPQDCDLVAALIGLRFVHLPSHLRKSSFSPIHLAIVQ